MTTVTVWNLNPRYVRDRFVAMTSAQVTKAVKRFSKAQAGEFLITITREGEGVAA